MLELIGAAVATVLCLFVVLSFFGSWFLHHGFSGIYDKEIVTNLFIHGVFALIAGFGWWYYLGRNIEITFTVN